MTEMNNHSVLNHYGYTTGTCATICAKASCEMLFTKENITQTEILTPKGIAVKMDILHTEITEHDVSCAVKKFSGDDPDITNGMFIYAKCEKIPFGIEITGGIGIGTVTKAGLDQPVGQKAINSVPRQMITAVVKEICEKYDYNGGIKVTVYAPQGVELAKKTLNEKLGIVGGISIIGTTGIIEPMSNSALIETIKLEENVLCQQGRKSLLLTIGNYSQKFLSEHMPDILDKSVMCSNFIGEAIDNALLLGFENILLIGHIGKLVKLGAGIMNTHSSVADGRMEVLITCGILCDVPCDVLKQIVQCVTVDGALALLKTVGKKDEVCSLLMQRIQHYLNLRVRNSVNIGAILFSDKFGVIGKTDNADALTQIITKEYH